jgi:hypothetical protein
MPHTSGLPQHTPSVSYDITPTKSVDVISVGVTLRRSGVMTAAIVERLTPEDLWELFQRVVPPAPERPQGGGHRRRGDREVLAAIIFVATPRAAPGPAVAGIWTVGCDRLPAVRRVTEARTWAKLRRLDLDENGPLTAANTMRQTVHSRDHVFVWRCERGCRRRHVSWSPANGSSDCCGRPSTR